MTKVVVIELTGDIPSTEIAKVATVTVETRSYPGKVAAILEYAASAAPVATKVTLEAVGLKTT